MDQFSSGQDYSTGQDFNLNSPQFGGPGKKPPSASLYIIPALILVGGVMFFVYHLITGIIALGDSMRQVVVPGQHDLTLNEPGTYTIFNEYRSVVDGKVFTNNGSLGELEISVNEKTSGDRMPLRPVNMSQNYNMGSRSGYAVYEFDVERPGVYVIDGSYPEGKEGGRLVLSVSGGFMEDLLFLIFSSIGIMFAALGGAVVLGLLIFFTRRRALKGVAPPLPGGQGY